MELSEIPALFETLIRISGRERHGTVAGVEIDLRHELLGSSWTPTITLGISNDDDPHVQFPWSGLLESKSAREPDCIVGVGDKIFVSDVDRLSLVDSIERDNEHVHETELRLAYLGVAHTNGTVEICSKPIFFRGVSSITLLKGRALVFNSISERIDKFVETKRDDTRVMADQLVSRSLSLRQSIKTRTRDISGWVFMEGDARSDAYNRWSLINDAIKLGYIWAKAETRFGLKASTISIMEDAASAMEVESNVKAGGSRGGKRSVESKEKAKDDEWRNRAREVIAESFRNNRIMGHDDRATLVLDKLRGEQRPSLPSHGQLVRLIARMKKAGGHPE